MNFHLYTNASVVSNFDRECAMAPALELLQDMCMTEGRQQWSNETE